VTFQWWAGIASGVCAVWSVFPYIRGILAGNSPSPVSWIIWAPLCAVWTAALWFDHRHAALGDPSGGRAALVLTAAETVGDGLIAVLAWRACRRRGERITLDMPRWQAALTLGGTFAAMGVVSASVAGVLTVGPVAAVVLLIGVDLAAATVTVRTLRSDPRAESVPSWVWYGTGELLATAAAIGAGWVYWGTSIAGALGAGAIIFMAWRGGGVTVPRWLPGLAVPAAALVLIAGVTAAASAAARRDMPAPPAGPARLTGPAGPILHPQFLHLPPSHHVQHKPAMVPVFAIAAGGPQPEARGA